jgi:hypothetical protein
VRIEVFVFVYLDFETELATGLFGAKKVVLSIEAIVRGDKIERMTGWYDELAVVVNLQTLSEKTQFDIAQKVWAKVDQLNLKRTLQLVNSSHDTSAAYVDWINGGSR